MCFRLLVLSALLMTLLGAVGCASFREGRTGEISAWPPAAPEAKKSVSVEILGLGGDLLESWKPKVLQAFNESGQFNSVTLAGNPNADLTARLVVSHQGHYNAIMAMLTGLTLYIIPSSATDEYSVEAQFIGRDGEIIASVTSSESVTLWQQLFLGFAYPFANPSKVMTGAYYDICRVAIIQAKSQGVF